MWPAAWIFSKAFSAGLVRKPLVADVDLEVDASCELVAAVDLQVDASCELVVV
ncbi:hypothetical protein M885DRAFT_577704 [Pelagophyceae sp. CCMP2097]|nr:hypothetical protein M885DRAFT_577704 [Pelagophyceae sp. CCMP2097]